MFPTIDYYMKCLSDEIDLEINRNIDHLTSVHAIEDYASYREKLGIISSLRLCKSDIMSRALKRLEQRS